jgi:hypothetical protein
MNSVIKDRRDPGLDKPSGAPKQSTRDAITPKRAKKEQRPRYRTLTPEEAQWLIEASHEPVVAPPLRDKPEYTTYSRDQVSSWVSEYLQYKGEERLKKENLNGFQRRRQDTEQE